MSILEKITPSELEFMEDFYCPEALADCLFSNFDNTSQFEDNLSSVRIGQFPLLSYDCMLDYNPKIGEKENFRLKEGAGQCYVLGGRKFGKSLITEIIDISISTLLLDNEDIAFTSLDALHIRGILEKVIVGLENHPILKQLRAKINRSPSYRLFIDRTGWLLESVNMALSSKDPGSQWFAKHKTRIFIEEASFETDEVYNKRIDAVSELGCVVRAAGMTNFTKYSPSGRTFFDISKKPWVMNVPQTINPRWDKKQKKKAIKEYGGENSVQYRIFVEGKVVEDGLSVMDMVRVRKCYKNEETIKHFEITKENYENFKYIINVERPKNAEMIYIAADIGETAPTEIIIMSLVTNGDTRKYHYLYNITVYNLAAKEQEIIFKHLGDLLEANIIALDTTDGEGRAIFRALELVYPKENLCWVGFNEKTPIGIAKTEQGYPMYKDGKPVYEEEYVSEWTMKRLKELLYDEKLLCPLDYKLDVQLNSIISTQSGTRTVYSVVSEEDHLLAAFRCFSLAEWQNEFRNIRSVRKKTFCKSTKL